MIPKFVPPGTAEEEDCGSDDDEAPRATTTPMPILDEVMRVSGGGEGVGAGGGEEVVGVDEGAAVESEMAV